MKHISHACPRPTHRSLAILAAAASIGVATAGHAAAPFVSAGADVAGLSGLSNHESLNVHAPSVSQTNSINDVSSRGSTAIASATGFADNTGTVKAFVQVSATTVAPDFPAVHAIAVGLGVVGDTFTFSPGTFSFLISWDGTTGGNCPTAGTCIFSITDTLFSFTTTLLNNDFMYDSGSPAQNVPPPHQQSARTTLTFAGITSLDLVEQFIVSAQVVGIPSASFTGDFSHTGHLYVDPVSFGASYTTASGNLFLTPSTVPSVPEPATMASLLAGLGALGLFTLRRRRPGA